MNRIQCPNCGHKLKYGREHAGKKAKCQKCGNSFQLPLPQIHSLCEITDSALAPAPKAEKITFSCPRCHKAVSVPNLGRWSTLTSGPAPEIGLKNLITGMPEKRTEAGITPTTCPHCKQSFPCAEIHNLRGAVMFNCPHCKHEMLAKPLQSPAILACEICGGGFTGGAIGNYKGDIIPVDEIPAETKEQLASSEGQLITIQCLCRQETYIHESKFAGSSLSTTLVMREISFSVVQPNYGNKQYPRNCPVCGRRLIFKVASYQDIHNRAKRWALIGLVGFPSSLVMLGWSLVTQMNDKTESALPSLGFVCSFILILPALLSIPYLVPQWRAKLITPDKCVSLTDSPKSQLLWQAATLFRKDATVKISHVV
jgi:transcription elongation factor Elf1